MDTETPLQRLASLLLGEPVKAWIRSRRPHTSWRAITAELCEKTNGQIDVEHQTLVNWAPDPPEMRTPPRGIAITPKAAS